MKQFKMLHPNDKIAQKWVLFTLCCIMKNIYDLIISNGYLATVYLVSSNIFQHSMLYFGFFIR